MRDFEKAKFKKNETSGFNTYNDFKENGVGFDDNDEIEKMQFY